MLDRSKFYQERAKYRPEESQRHYHKLLQQYYRHFIPEGAAVLEVGCGMGNLLASLNPARGVGVDFSPAMLSLARLTHPTIEFVTGEAARFEVEGKFDYIIISDLVNDHPDVQALLEHLRQFATEKTRLVLNFFNNLWRPILALAEQLEWKAPTLPQNWLSATDMRNLLRLAGWDVIRQDTKILCPANILILDEVLNQLAAPLASPLCLSVFQIARLQPLAVLKKAYTCSVVVPARNEAGNIEDAVKRIPEMGAGTEIIFIEGGSTDNTWEEIQRVAAAYPQRNIKVLKQSTKGKGGAVREAFAAATGDILFILDADLTMPPEQLPKYYQAISSGTGEFINGVRLVYPMEDEAMQFLNMVANKFFGLAFSWLIGQPIKDTLCGTKVLFRQDYETIARNRAYFGDFDPFGDFDLIFGAAKLNLKITDLPIRYQARTYGETNINRWSHGALLFRMMFFAAGRLKFI